MNNILNDLYGQENVKTVLGKLVESGNIPNALLFSGKEGIGKDFAAIKLSQLLNYSDDEELFIKNNRVIESFAKPFVKYVIPLPRGRNETESDGAFDKLDQEDLNNYKDELAKKILNPYHNISLPRANAIKINSIRDIKDFLSYDYSDIKYRTVLISDAHLLSEGAQNALLKSLEEPPAGVIFILTTPYPNQLRETIRSRCWHIKFQPLSNNDLRFILLKKFSITEKEAEKVIPFSSGSSHNALALLDYGIEDLIEKTISILRFSLARKYNTAFDEFLKAVDDNSDYLNVIIQFLVFWLSDAQRFKANQEIKFFIDNEHRITIEKFVQIYPDSEIYDLITRFEILSADIRRNININTIVMNVIMEIANISLNKSA